MVSANILKKSIQLYNDLTQFDAKEKELTAKDEKLSGTKQATSLENAISHYNQQAKDLLGSHFDFTQ